MNCNLSLDLILQKDYKEFSYGRFRIAFSIVLLRPKMFEDNYSIEAIDSY